MDWATTKNLITVLTVSKDALHVYAAFVVQVATAAAFRKGLGSWLPWALVFIVVLLNEGLDIFLGEERYVAAWQVRGALHDVLNSMLLPTLLLLLCRRAPQLFYPVSASSSSY